MHQDVEKILYSEEELHAAIQKVGQQISRDYEDKNLFLVSVLKGSLVFMADLMREITIPCMIDFLAVSSYGNGTKSSGEVQMIKDLNIPLEDKDLLLVEDILDSGVTLAYLKKTLAMRHPKSIKICALLDKPARRKADISADYRCFEVPDGFLVGYGLDYAEYYRNLPYIGILKPSVYEGK